MEIKKWAKKQEKRRKERSAPLRPTDVNTPRKSFCKKEKSENFKKEIKKKRKTNENTMKNVAMNPLEFGASQLESRVLAAAASNHKAKRIICNQSKKSRSREFAVVASRVSVPRRRVSRERERTIDGKRVSRTATSNSASDFCICCRLKTERCFARPTIAHWIV